MQAGRLRERVAIQTNMPTRDSYGGEVDNWSTTATVWASVLPASSGERFITGGMQRQAEITHTVRIRYRAGITPRQRLLWDSRVLQIESVIDPDGRRRETVLLCREIV